MTDTVPLPPCDPAQCIPYQSIRYINGYAEVYVHQFARDYAAAVSAADNAALRAEKTELRMELAAHIINDALQQNEIDALRKRVEELEAARDEWAAKWQELRRELGELKWPGMTKRVRATTAALPKGCPYCTSTNSIGEVLYDQNCSHCVNRMVIPSQLKDPKT